MSQPTQRQAVTLPAWLAIGVSCPALADGLGGLQAMGFLMFVFSSIIPLFVMIAALLKTTAGKARRLAIFSAALGTLYVWWGTDSLDLPFLASLNPWLNADTAVAATICIVLIVGNLMIFCPSWRSRGYVLSAAAAFVALQWTMTPGNAFYYDHDPVDVDTESVRVLNENYIAWNDRLIYSETEIPARFVARPVEPIQAIVEKQDDNRYSLVTSEVNRDPRLNSRSRYKTETGFWFPIQPSHRLATVVAAGQLLPEDWQADSQLLISAASRRGSDVWIRFLVEHGANVNHVDDSGNSPLSTALKRGDPLTARLLADLGADPNVDLDSGNRIWHFAAREADYTDDWLLDFLLEYGANPSIRNDYGQTAGAVFYAYLGTGGKTAARQEMIRETWSRVLED